MSPLKVLISGGGIAGTAAAFWFSRLGHTVTVVEWFPSLRATGLQLDLRGHGIEVMKRMGLEAEFRAKRAPEHGVQIVDKTGKRHAFFPANTSGKGLQDFTSEWEIMRGDICRIIHDATKERVKYIFGTSIERFEDKNDRVEVRFANGTEDTYDLLIGADGQNSRTRRMMLGVDTVAADKVIPLGGYIGYLRIPTPIQEGEEYIATWYLATGSRFIMTRRHSPTEMQVYLICTSNTPIIANAYRKGAAEEKAAFTDFFRGAGWRTEEFLEALAVSDDFYCERVAFVDLDSWSRGRTVLVGDAGYCPSVMTGMGTTSALVGAYILAGEIGKHCVGADPRAGVTAALQAYEERYRPFMRQVQRGLVEGGGSMPFPTGRFGIAVINRLAGIVAALRLNVIGGWVLREKVQDWDLPDYELLRT